MTVRIKETGNTVLSGWKVSWYQVDHDGGMSRSKVITEYDDAVIFKRLVEEADEHFPGVAVLAEHGLGRYAEWVNPEAILMLKHYLDRADDIRPAETLKEVRRIVDAIVDPSRLRQILSEYDQ